MQLLRFVLNAYRFNAKQFGRLDMAQLTGNDAHSQTIQTSRHCISAATALIQARFI
jgi:hypothetical protein